MANGGAFLCRFEIITTFAADNAYDNEAQTHRHFDQAPP
jgi:hypothetical protein